MAQGKRKARLQFEPIGLYVYCQYHPAFPDWLKVSVPPSKRYWQAEEKRWFIDKGWADQVLAKVREVFDVTEIIDDRGFRDKQGNVRWDVQNPSESFYTHRDHQNKRKEQEDKRQQQEESRRKQREQENSYRDFFREERRRQQQYRQQVAPSTKLSPEDAFKLFELPYGAPSIDIKKAYRKMALKYHPDRNQGDAGAMEMMKKVNAAYDLLKPYLV